MIPPFEVLYNDTAVPFHWCFTRQQLEARLAALPPPPPLATPAPQARAATALPVAA